MVEVRGGRAFRVAGRGMRVEQGGQVNGCHGGLNKATAREMARAVTHTI